MKGQRSIELHVRSPHKEVITCWSDGLARKDLIRDHYKSSWHSRWSPDACRIVLEVLQSGERLTKRAAASRRRILVVREGKAQSLYGGDHGDTWYAATLMQGLAADSRWAPMNVDGAGDCSAWADAVTVYLSTARVMATGLARPGGVVVLAGAIASTATTNSLEPVYKDARAELIENGGFTLVGERYVLSRHAWFDRPSAAASVLAGSNTNGRSSWRSEAAQTWAELELG